MFGSLIAGIFAGGVSFFLPKTYESVAIVRLSEEEVAMLHAAPVLDPLIAKFNLLADAGGDFDDARQNLIQRLQYTFDKRTKLVTLIAKGDAADQAQQLGISAVALLLNEWQPKGQERRLLEKTIAINNQANDLSEEAIDSVRRTLKKGAVSDLAQESAIKNLSVLLSDIVKRTQENELIRQKLEPRGAEVFVQEFTLPQRSHAKSRSKFIMLVILVAGFVLLTYIFLRENIKTAIKNQESADKLMAIRSALVLFGGRK